MNHSRKIVLVADGIPQKNGAGISQTLYNLFSGYPEKVTVICEEQEDLSVNLHPLACDTLFYRGFRVKPVANRLGRFINPFIYRVNSAWLSRSPIPGAIGSLREECIVVVSTNVVHKLIFAWRLLQAGFTVVPYFMDDWLDGNLTRWKGGSVQQVAADLLRKAPARLMISANLQQILEQRFQLPDVPTLVVHNPSPPPLNPHTKTHTIFPPSGEPGVTPSHSPANLSTNHPVNLIIYAGSIWPMHADALVVTAKAIHLLQAQGKRDFSLCIYTSQGHWEKYKPLLGGEGVHWGGWLPYDEVRATFADAWLLLCTASFHPAQQAYTLSSVQTKITDYMAAGKPVLYAGPAHGASGLFVQQYQVGYCLSGTDATELANQLQLIDANPNEYNRKCAQAISEAATTFSKVRVQEKLYNFLHNSVGGHL